MKQEELLIIGGLVGLGIYIYYKNRGSSPPPMSPLVNPELTPYSAREHNLYRLYMDRNMSRTGPGEAKFEGLTRNEFSTFVKGLREFGIEVPDNVTPELYRNDQSAARSIREKIYNNDANAPEVNLKKNLEVNNNAVQPAGSRATSNNLPDTDPSVTEAPVTSAPGFSRTVKAKK